MGSVPIRVVAKTISGAELNDAGTQQDSVGTCRQIAKYRRCVRAPRLGDPADVKAQLLRLAHEVQREDHLSRILRKLGLSSRAGIARRFAELDGASMTQEFGA
jgi:hypothetical protein